MDMSAAYIKSVNDKTDARISFDKYHVIAAMNHAVDLVRNEEHKEQMREGDDRLKKTKYLWYRSKKRMTTRQRQRLKTLNRSTYKVAWAWRRVR